MKGKKKHTRYITERPTHKPRIRSSNFLLTLHHKAMNEKINPLKHFKISIQITIKTKKLKEKKRIDISKSMIVSSALDSINFFFF